VVPKWKEKPYKKYMVFESLGWIGLKYFLHRSKLKDEPPPLDVEAESLNNSVTDSGSMWKFSLAHTSCQKNEKKGQSCIML
jgi:hypothetical protein